MKKINDFTGRFTVAFRPMTHMTSPAPSCGTINWRICLQTLLGLTAMIALLSGCTLTSGNSGGSTEHNSVASSSHWKLEQRFAGWRFTNSGARHTDYPGSREWAAHLKKLARGDFSRNNDLPDGHVLSEERAAALYDLGSLSAKRGSLAATWFGHATFHLQSGGNSILTDPIFSGKTGPVGLGLARMAPVRPHPDRIEHLDAILISHSDYDHLDLPTLRRLSKRFPDALLIVPKGTRPLLRGTGFRNVAELGHFESHEQGAMRITAVPAIHGTRRLPWPINFSHWNGYRISIGGHEIYFSGDTGAGEFSKELQAQTGKSDIAIVPAGAWAPRDFEKPFHVNPDEAMELARDSGAQTAIAMHWGTLPLSQDKSGRQKSEFLKAGRRAGLKTVVMRIGETRVLK